MLVHERDGGVATPSPTLGPSALQARDQRVAELLTNLTRALEDPGADAAGLATPGARDRLQMIEANVRRIGITDLRLRYSGPRDDGESATAVIAGTVSAKQRHPVGWRPPADGHGQHGPGAAGSLRADAGQDDPASPGKAWTADVRLSWRIAAYETVRSHQDVGVVIVDDGSRARFGGIVAGTEGDRVPLWLLQGLAVHKSERTLALAPSRATAVALSRLAETAVATVGRVLPRWQGALVVTEPSSRDLLDQTVGAGPGTTALLAAVTTTTDGSSGRGAPEHVLVNPEVFDELGPNAQQIVISHEATHVATAGATSPMPQWLIEGFADYVALRDLDIPVQTSARQLLAEVRRDGAPARLPTDRDFTGGSADLGADYEAAWLAAKFIAERYGEQKLVSFYRATDTSDVIGQTFRTILGTTRRDFTRAWAAYTESLASGG